MVTSIAYPRPINETLNYPRQVGEPLTVEAFSAEVIELADDSIRIDFSEALSPADWAAVEEGREAIRRGDFITLEEYERKRTR